jgi:hypothetical protein
MAEDAGASHSPKGSPRGIGNRNKGEVSSIPSASLSLSLSTLPLTAIDIDGNAWKQRMSVVATDAHILHIEEVALMAKRGESASPELLHIDLPCGAVMRLHADQLQIKQGALLL